MAAVRRERGRMPACVAATVSVQRVESEFGCWTMFEWSPELDDPLACAVERIWYFDGTMTHAVERTFPNGKLELVVQLDTPHRPAGEDAPYPALALTGMHLRPLLVEAPSARCRVMGVRLSVTGARAILGVPLRELIDTTADLRTLIGRTAEELGERCASARGGEQAILDARRWTQDRFAAGEALPAWLVWTATTIEAHDGLARLAELCAATGVGASRFAERFRSEFGTTPKRYARLVRFRRTIAELHGRATELHAEALSLADVAFSAGYFDQAHMHAEFREHAGMTPRAFLTSVHYPGSVSLPESHR